LADDKKTIKIKARHVSGGIRYRRAGIGLTKEYKEMEVTPKTLKILKEDPRVDSVVLEEKPKKDK